MSKDKTTKQPASLKELLYDKTEIDIAIAIVDSFQDDIDDYLATTISEDNY